MGPIAWALGLALLGAPAVAEVLPAGGAGAGSTLTEGELNAFRLAVQGCWNVGAISAEATRTTVTVTFRLDEEARIEGDVALVSDDAPTREAARQAFEAARRAVLRCQGSGYPLPPEKREAWREVTMTFDPTQGSVR